MEAAGRQQHKVTNKIPSDVYNGPYNWDWNEPACWICKLGEGRCTNKSNESDYRWNPRCYDGPILITVGTKDKVWPFEQTQRLEAKLKKFGLAPEVTDFPDANHGFHGADEMRRRDLVLDFLKRVP